MNVNSIKDCPPASKGVVLAEHFFRPYKALEPYWNDQAQRWRDLTQSKEDPSSRKAILLFKQLLIVPLVVATVAVLIPATLAALIKTFTDSKKLAWKWCMIEKDGAFSKHCSDMNVAHRQTMVGILHQMNGAPTDAENKALARKLKESLGVSFVDVDTVHTLPGSDLFNRKITIIPTTNKWNFFSNAFINSIDPIFTKEMIPYLPDLILGVQRAPSDQANLKMVKDALSSVRRVELVLGDAMKTLELRVYR